MKQAAGKTTKGCTPKNKTLRVVLVTVLIFAAIFAIAAGVFIIAGITGDHSNLDKTANISESDTQEDNAVEQTGQTDIQEDNVAEPTEQPNPTLKERQTEKTAALTIPGGAYFNTGREFNSTPGGTYASEQRWETVETHLLNESNDPWFVSEFLVTVTPVEKPDMTITTQVPWRIHWEVTKPDTEPYTSAELILYQYDTKGNLVKTNGFGWKGNYSADTEGTTAAFPPGEYTLAVFLRGTGISLDFQQLVENT